MSKTEQFDILVAGAGPVGKCAALALGQAGFSVALVAPEPPQIDRRTTALMVPSINLLSDLKVWQNLKPSAGPLAAMRIIDATKNLVRARPVTFNANEIDEEAFGWNMPNEALNGALDLQIADEPSITRIKESVETYTPSDETITATLTSGRDLSVKLIAAADGRNSPARAAAGITLRQWSYAQTAFVTTFEHRLAHENMSTEFHTSLGPCVQVPLPGHSSSLVWVVTPQKAEELSAMTDADLSRAIETQLYSTLGKVTVGPNRQTYPLSGQYPDKFAAKRIALLGEAAHVFPPIGAQGLNLGLRDVEDLRAAALGSPVDPGAESVLAQYDRTRRPDILARTSAVDALNRSLLSTLLPTHMARAIGLAALDMTPPLRALFMREGMRPGDGLSQLLGSLKRLLPQGSANRT